MTPSTVVAGQENTFNIKLRDQYDNEITEGGQVPQPQPRDLACAVTDSSTRPSPSEAFRLLFLRALTVLTGSVGLRRPTVSLSIQREEICKTESTGVFRGLKRACTGIQ